MTGATKRTTALQIRWSVPDGRVVLEPEDQDRFVLRFGEIIDACQKLRDEDRYIKQFNILVQRLSAWLTLRSDVQSAYLTLRDSQLVFIAVTESAKYDADFEDELSDLDIELAHDPDLQGVDFGVLSLPSAPDMSLASFMHPSATFELAGDRDHDHD